MHISPEGGHWDCAEATTSAEGVSQEQIFLPGEAGGATEGNERRRRRPEGIARETGAIKSGDG